jgi:hypothetical protein
MGARRWPGRLLGVLLAAFALTVTPCTAVAGAAPPDVSCAIRTAMDGTWFDGPGSGPLGWLELRHGCHTWGGRSYVYYYLKPGLSDDSTDEPPWVWAGYPYEGWYRAPYTWPTRSATIEVRLESPRLHVRYSLTDGESYDRYFHRLYEVPPAPAVARAAKPGRAAPPDVFCLVRPPLQGTWVAQRPGAVGSVDIAYICPAYPGADVARYEVRPWFANELFEQPGWLLTVEDDQGWRRVYYNGEGRVLYLWVRLESGQLHVWYRLSRPSGALLANVDTYFTRAAGRPEGP